jgi:hypothetical protein
VRAGSDADDEEKRLLAAGTAALSESAFAAYYEATDTARFILARNATKVCFATPSPTSASLLTDTASVACLDG